MRLNIVAAALALLIMVNCSTCLAQWVQNDEDPVNAGQSNQSAEGAPVTWSWLTDANGLRARAEVEIFNHYYSVDILNVLMDPATELTRAWKWTGCDEPAAATFTLSWSGQVSAHTADASAELHHFAEAYEFSYVKVSSGDFAEDDNDKWVALSLQKVELPKDAGENQEKNASLSGKISVGSILSGAWTGTMELALGPFTRGPASLTTGEETSDTLSAASSMASFNHPGGGTNTTVSAKAYHIATAQVRGRSSNGQQTPDDEDFDANAVAEAKSTTFTIGKD